MSHRENCALLFVLFVLDRYKPCVMIPQFWRFRRLFPPICLKKRKKQNCSFPDGQNPARDNDFNTSCIGVATSYRNTKQVLNDTEEVTIRGDLTVFV